MERLKKHDEEEEKIKMKQKESKIKAQIEAVKASRTHRKQIEMEKVIS